MNIIVRNMIHSDIEDLARAFASQGWLLPASVFENSYNRMLRRNCDMLVAEAKGQPAGYLRLEWVDAGEEAGYAWAPEIQEFVVLSRFMGTGISEALNAEAERRVSVKTGEIPGNALIAIYGDPPPRPPFRGSYVLDGLLVNGEGRFIRSRSAEDARHGMVISLRSGHRV